MRNGGTRYARMGFGLVSMLTPSPISFGSSIYDSGQLKFIL